MPGPGGNAGQFHPTKKKNKDLLFSQRTHKHSQPLICIIHSIKKFKKNFKPTLDWAISPGAGSMMWLRTMG